MSGEISKYYEQYRLDLQVCRQLDSFPEREKSHAAICFHAQQAAEKALKALILSYKIQDKGFQSHDVKYLLGILQKVYEIPVDFITKANYLTMFAVDARYEATESYTDSESGTAMFYAQQICDWVEESLKLVKH